MTELQLRNRVALIVIVGHVAVFAFGLFGLGLFGPLFGSDALQTILMATPILAVIGAAAMKWLAADRRDDPHDEPVDPTFAFVAQFLPVALICFIFLLFIATYFQARGLGPEQLRIYIGYIETFFGVYIGGISDRLFGQKRAGRATRRAAAS